MDHTLVKMSRQVTTNKKLSIIITAIGVVYGDIGTSPLYALKSCFNMGGLAVTELNLFGLISLFVWALLLIVSLKYVQLVLNFQHQGEGGILVLSSLCSKLHLGVGKAFPITLGIIGAALFFSDGIITPAISILSALEGLETIVPTIDGYTAWLAAGILVLLCIAQKYGSGGLGHYFGPIMIVWFFTLGSMGMYQIMQQPTILYAINPIYAVEFICENGWQTLIVMGGVILVVTGAEALYADLGHFGKKPISLAWNRFVCPALLLNYLGQGALLLRTPEAIANPFYFMVPFWCISPLVMLATIATIIASQAVISGIFSISWQGVMLNYLPRMRVLHTSDQQRGQVYVPIINYFICILTIGAVMHFGSSTSLATAYGLSVSGVMLITTALMMLAMHYRRRWPWYWLILFFAPLIILDLLFTFANLVKIIEGAWYTMAVTILAAYTMFTWRRGNKAIHEKRQFLQQSLDDYIVSYASQHKQRIPQTAIFICKYPNKVPETLLIHLQHNKLLHQKIFFCSVVVTDMPTIPVAERYQARSIHQDIRHLTIYYGFQEVPNLVEVLKWAQAQNLIADNEGLSFFFSKEIAASSNRRLMSGMTEAFYLYLSKNALAAYEFYKVPYDKVVELVVRYKV